MAVLVTGGAGFIGSVLVEELLKRDYKVKVIDNLIWGNNLPAEFYKYPSFEFIKADIRRYSDVSKAVEGVDNIIHLAAIVGDPACKKSPALSKETNLDASIHLFEQAKKKGVKRFVFASTCSNYGKMDDPNGFVDEDSALKPVSLYAELKVKFENHILNSVSSNGVCPVLLRFATAYGISPRMRFDLTVNEFTKELVLDRELLVFGQQFWRPYCHVRDLARACIYALNADKDKVSHNVFNVGSSQENYQKQMIVEEIKKQLPSVNVKYVKKDEDPRDYKVNFTKINKILGFKITKTVPDGIRQIRRALKQGSFPDPDSPVYKNS
ncbi:MAG: NAD(P)-dependent oxidoreductase [Candidatus Omnitrophota bacterium]